MLLSGCHSEEMGAAGPPIARVASTDQSQMEQVAQSYVTALQAHDYAKAEAAMSPKFRAGTPPAQLKALLGGPDKPLVGAKDFRFDPAQSLAHGTRAALRAGFQGSDGKPYRTSFQLTKPGASWAVDIVYPPVTLTLGGTRTVTLKGTH